MYCHLYSGKPQTDYLINELETRGVRIIKTSEYNEQWLVILDDFINIPQR